MDYGALIAKIAHSFHCRRRAAGDYEDPALNWQSAERVFDHYAEPPREDDPMWVSDHERYAQYQPLIQQYFDSLPDDA